MAKLPPPFVLLLLLALAAAGLASAARTAITTTIVEVDGGSTSKEHCREKMLRCLKYLTTRSRGPTNPMAEKLVRMCSVHLKSMDEQCMHESLETMVMKMMQKYEVTGQDMEKTMLQKPRGLDLDGYNGFIGWGVDGFGPEQTDPDKPTYEILV